MTTPYTDHNATQPSQRRVARRACRSATALIGALGAVTTFGYSATASVPSNDGALLPEGVYRTPEVTLDDQIATALDAGFTEADVNAVLGAGDPTETHQVALQLANGGWTQLDSYNGGPEEVGWRGTYEVIDDHTVVATDPGAVITYTYTFDGEQLTLDMIDDQCAPCGDDVGELIIQTILFETAPFTLAEPAGSDVTAAAAPAAYTSTSFVVPFEVTLPDWAAPEPAVTESNFVTWEGTDSDRGIRFLAPVSLYPPGSTTTTPLPDDYVSYLMSQTDHGATFNDIVETTIDGLPATVVTATTDQSIDGGLGCQADGLTAEDCFGLQPDLSLRLAVVEVGDQPLLIWVRDIAGVDAEYDTFDEMLASLHFGEPDTSDQPVASTSETVAVDGIRGCAPACVTGLSAPGPLPTGEFGTTYFLDGHLGLTFEPGWASTEDQGVEFNASPEGESDHNRVLFWSDLIPVGPDGNAVDVVPNTAAGFLEWLAGRPGVELSQPAPTTIGAAQIPALTADMSVADDAENEDPECPADACIMPFTWVNVAPAVYATTQPWILRMYVADVVYGGEQHTITFAIEASDRATLEAFLPSAERLIASATAPLEPA